MAKVLIIIRPQKQKAADTGDKSFRPWDVGIVKEDTDPIGETTREDMLVAHAEGPKAAWAHLVADVRTTPQLTSGQATAVMGYLAGLYSTLKPSVAAQINALDPQDADAKINAAVEKAKTALKDRLVEVVDSIREDVAEAQTIPAQVVTKARRYYIDKDQCLTTAQQATLDELVVLLEQRKGLAGKYKELSGFTFRAQTERDSTARLAMKAEFDGLMDGLNDLDSQIALKASSIPEITITAAKVIDRGLE